MNLRLARISVRVITAGIADNLKKKYPDFEKEIDKLVERDPSRRGKYLQWSVKQLAAGAKMEDLAPTIEMFHRLHSRMPEKDINKYKDLKELEDAVKDVEAKKTKRQEKRDVKVSGSEKIFENDKIVVINVTSKRACVHYGQGTRWCITMEDAPYFEDYSGEYNMQFYFIIRKQPLGQCECGTKQFEKEEDGFVCKNCGKFYDEEPGDKLDKVAVAAHRNLNNKVEYYEYYREDDELIDERDLDEIEGYDPSILNLIEKHAEKQPTTFGTRAREEPNAELILELLKPENRDHINALREAINKADADEIRQAMPQILAVLEGDSLSETDKGPIIIDLGTKFGGYIDRSTGSVTSAREDPELIKQLEDILKKDWEIVGDLFKFAYSVNGSDPEALRQQAIRDGAGLDLVNFFLYDREFQKTNEGADLEELLEAIAEDATAEEINEFITKSDEFDVDFDALISYYGPEFIEKFKEKILRSRLPGAALNFLIYGGSNSYTIRSHVDMKQFGDIITQGDDPKAAYEFARYFPKVADIPKVIEVVLNGDNTAAAADLAIHLKRMSNSHARKMNPEEILALQEVVINGTKGFKSESVIKFAKNFPKIADIPRLQEQIMEDGFISRMIEFANDVKGANIEKFEDAVINSRNLHNITKFAGVKGANVPKLQRGFEEALVNPDLSRPNMSLKTLEFAKIPGVDIESLQEAVIKAKDSHTIFDFAREVEGANISRLHEAMKETGDERYIKYFEEYIEEHAKETKKTSAKMDPYKLAFRVAILFDKKSVKESIEAGELQGKLQKAFDEAREKYVDQLKAEGRTLRGKDALKYRIEVDPDKVTIHDWLGGAHDYPIENPDQDVDEYIQDEVYMFFPDLFPDYTVYQWD